MFNISSLYTCFNCNHQIVAHIFTTSIYTRILLLLRISKTKYVEKNMLEIDQNSLRGIFYFFFYTENNLSENCKACDQINILT